MRSRDLTDLLLLAAVWGGSFLFMRMAAPEFGTMALAELRVGIAAACLLPFALWQGRLGPLLRNALPLFGVGAFNAALPFALYAYAAGSLGAGFLSIANAVAPMWGGVIGWLWLKDRLPWTSALGLAVGFLGIVALVWDKLDFTSGGSGPAVLAAIVAPLCYGIGANFTKRYLTGVDALTSATGTMTMAAIMLMPLAIMHWPEQPVSIRAWTAIILLAVLCTTIAYIIFFRLIANIGPTRAVTVTFLVPVFGMFWGAFLLGEVITRPIIVGACVILVGTALVIAGKPIAKLANGLRPSRRAPPR